MGYQKSHSAGKKQGLKMFLSIWFLFILAFFSGSWIFVLALRLYWQIRLQRHVWDENSRTDNISRVI